MLPRLVFLGFVACLLGRGRAAEVVLKLSEPKGAAIADAVVTLTAMDGKSAAVTAGAPIEIVQQGKEFSPRVSVVSLGTTVSFPNRDTSEHQVYSLSDAKKFDLPLHKPGSKSGAIVCDRAGVIVVGCNVHAWMVSYIVVADTPWFAKSDAAGLAKIASVPEGLYRAQIWHARLGDPEIRELTVSATNPAAVEVTLTLKPEKRLSRRPEIGGGGYK